MLKSLDNSNGIQYYGGNDPAKMGGRFKKGESRGARGEGGIKPVKGGKWFPGSSKEGFRWTPSDPKDIPPRLRR